jgi:hypothetical protein
MKTVTSRGWSRSVLVYEVMTPFPFGFSKSGDREPLVVSMTAARLGDRVIFAGRSATLALPLGARVGLSGQLLLVGDPTATSALETLATTQGILLERIGETPIPASYDLVVVEVTGGWRAHLVTLRAAVRPGGRLVVVLGDPRSGWLARLRPAPSSEASEADVLEAVAKASWRKARVIGSRDGQTFIEAFAAPHVQSPQ